MSLRRPVFIFLFFAFLTVSFPREAFPDGERDFFSFERFFLNQGLVDRIPADGRTQTDINIFAANLTDGLYAFSSGRWEEAKAFFLKARGVWPEYFGTDFLLALVYEKEGDHGTAARYYKSYLNKLKDFHSGRYRISGPIIRSLSASGVEAYPAARQLIEQRLAGYGMDLDRVRPVITPPGFLMPLTVVLILGAGYAFAHFRLLPYLRMQHRIKNPPEGFWVCRNCGRANPDLDKECERCRRPRH